MTTLMWIYASTCILCVPLILVLCANEFKQEQGHCELTLADVALAVVLGIIPGVNLAITLAMLIGLGRNIVVWSNKK